MAVLRGAAHDHAPSPGEGERLCVGGPCARTSEARKALAGAPLLLVEGPALRSACNEVRCAACVCAHVCRCMYVCVYVCVCGYMYVPVCECVYVCVGFLFKN